MRLSVLAMVVLMAGFAQAKPGVKSFDGGCREAVHSLHQYARKYQWADNVAVDATERYLQEQSETLSQVTADPDDDQTSESMPTFVYASVRNALDSLKAFVPNERLDEVAMICIQ